MYDIMLINPPAPYMIEPDAQEHLGLLYLVSGMRKRGWKVAYMNLVGTPVKEALNNLPEAKLYGFTTTFVDYDVVEELSKELLAKGKKTLLGGPYVSACPDRITQDAFSAMLLGEGDITLDQILKDNQKGELKKIYKGEIVADLDTIPFPAREDGKEQKGSIFIKEKKYGGGGTTNIISSRGCPFNCIEENQVVQFSRKPNGKIRNAKIGDKLMSYNEKTKAIEETEIVNKKIIQKEVFEIELEDGKKIQATDNHKFFTDRGWKELKDLTEKDEILVIDFIEKISFNKQVCNPMKDKRVVKRMVKTSRERGAYLVTSKRVKKAWREEKMNPNHPNLVSARRKTKNVGKDNGMFNANSKYRNFYDLKKTVKKDKTILCSRCKSDKHLLVHHKDFNHGNDSIANLEIICKSCHEKIHRKILNIHKMRKVLKDEI